MIRGLCRVQVWALSLLSLGCSLPVLGQSATEHHAWQDQRTFEPMSRTASAITGAIELFGNPSFADVGSTMRIAFAGGRQPVDLTSVGASWREWSIGGGMQTAEVFRMSADPGSLLNGNALCGEPARFLVFSEGSMMGGGGMLEVAVFSGHEAPFDIQSEGLCATFNYVIE